MGPYKGSESAREREFFKYYQPTVPLKPGTPVPLPQSSRDASLTAFAQLGALRLDVKRAMTSLVGRELQYVIAEATQTLSLQDDTIHEKADGLWKGETILPRRDGPCSVAMDLFTGVLEGKGDYLVVSDLSTDDRFSHINLAEGSPRMKFFAAVPLVSVKGLVVGAFYIVDDTPRERLFNAQLAFMKDVASTIMAHLEAGRVKQQHKRAERMIRGLGLYVEGKSSLREWWLNTGHKADELEVTEKARQGESLNQQADQEFGVQDVPDDLATAAIASVPSSYHKGYPLSSDGFQAAIGNVSRRRTPQYSPDGRTDITDDSALLSTSPESVFTKQPGASNSTLTGNTRTSSKAPLRHTPQDNQHPTNDPLGDTSGARLQEAVLSDELKESLSRASNLIRESIAVDGALFLDASVGTFGGSSTKADIGFIGPTARNDDGTLLTTSSSDEARQRFVSIQQQSRPCANLRSGGMAQGYSGKACGVLGYSTSTRSSLNMHEPSQLHSGVKEEFLRKLLRRYPHGKVFNFRDNGSLSSSEDEIQNASQTGTGMTSKERQGVGKDSVRRRGKKKASREAEAREILRFLPSARCVAFFPLWDSHKERWFAGSFVWATDPTRVLDPDEDLTYLASFGNSIMAEVSRLSALMSSQLKDSFVSSISHELRSPLHGVLASVEFLQDSPLNTFQQEMVSNIGSCGKALLDTLDHVLEFTKLRRAVTDKAQDSNPRSGPKRTRSGPSSPLPTRSNAPVDLRILTEEVLQGLYTGSAFEKRQSISDRQSLSLVPDSSLSATRPVPPMIIADLFWQENWSFEIDPGAWRRLVMNIFGNSLKYTDTGFVRVALRSSDAKESSSDDTSSSTVTLTILDSGKGISKEFSGHHLYTPFAQEDSLAVGSGLGMSIVRHIVDELEGTISVESEQGFGTDVSISLPLTQAKASVVHGNETDLISQVRDQMHGLRMCLVGFEVLPDLVDEPTGILSVAARGKLYLKDSLVTLLNDWFGVEAAVEATLNPAPGAVSFIMEPVFNKLLSAGLPAVKVDTAPYRKSVVFVLCSKQCDVCPAIVHSAFEVVYVQQPIGPLKLATVLNAHLLSILPQEYGYLTNDLPAGSSDQVPKNVQIKAVSSSLEELSRESLANFSVSPKGPSSTSSDLFGSSTPPGLYQTRASVFDRRIAAGESSSQYVLLVDDNAINLKILVVYMEKLGIDHLTAENGLVATQEYQRATRPFNLVLMDISMPVMDGVEASRNIRLFEKESKKVRVPIVAITGAASEGAQQEAFGAGIDQFLIKPVSLKVLKGILEAYKPT